MSAPAFYACIYVASGKLCVLLGVWKEKENAILLFL